MDNLLSKIKYYYPKDNDLLVRAYNYAKAAHANQKRASGEDYFIHPYCVAEILVDTQTGVNYLYYWSGNGGGLTPLLDREGKPVITAVGGGPERS